MFTRILDMTVLLLLGVAIVLPRPDVRVKPAMVVDASERDRVAELQTKLLSNPGDVETARSLANIFMDAHHPDWALAALSGALDAHPSDHRLHSLRALALADHFEGATAYQAAARALELCRVGSSAPCGEGETARLELLVSTLERIKNIDMRTDPNSAKEQIIKALRPTYIPRHPTNKGATKPPAANTPPAAPAPRP